MIRFETAPFETVDLNPDHIVAVSAYHLLSGARGFKINMSNNTWYEWEGEGAKNAQKTYEYNAVIRNSINEVGEGEGAHI